MRIKELIRIALFSSPMIGLYSLFPLFLFLDSAAVLQHPIATFGVGKLISATALISGIVFLQWLFNIFLIRFLHPLKAFRTRKVLVVVLSYTFVFVIIWFMDVYRQEALDKVDLNFIRFYPFINGIAFNTFILFVIALVTSRNKSATLEIEKAHLELENVTAKHEQLKHQVHPHFLFNAMNTLKVLIRREPVKAEKYVVHLSSFLRSSITETEKDVVTVKNELSICTNYIELQKVRFKDAIVFDFDVPSEVVEKCYLPVFTLQSLAENAINHNALTKSTPLNIKVSYDCSSQTIRFTNNLIPKFHAETSTGTGLKNLSNRFKLLMGEAIEITRDEDRNVFEVSFKILNK